MITPADVARLAGYLLHTWLRIHLLGPLVSDTTRIMDFSFSDFMIEQLSMKMLTPITVDRDLCQGLSAVWTVPHHGVWRLHATKSYLVRIRLKRPEVRSHELCIVNCADSWTV